MQFSPITLPSGRAPRFLVLADMQALGMKMMTTQVVRSLSRRFPDGKIGVLTSEGGSGFYRPSPYPVHVHKIPDAPPFCSSGIHYLASTIAAGQYDAVIALPFTEYHYGQLVFNEKINFPFRIGSNRILGGMMRENLSEIPEEFRFNCNVECPHSIVAPEEYMGKAMLRYLEPFGISGQDMRPEAWSSSADKETVESRLFGSGVLPGDFLLTLNLGANQGHNQWRMGTLADVANKISNYWNEHLSDGHGRLVFLANYYSGGQEYFFSRFQAALRNIGGLASPMIGMPNKSPGELAQIIAASNYVITPETGTAHVAQALNIPATVVYQSESVKHGWMLPGSRVTPLISSEDIVASVPSDDIFINSLTALLQWCRK